MHQDYDPMAIESHPAAPGTERERKRKRTKGESSSSSAAAAAASSPTLNWKSDVEQKRYSCKLLDALRRVRSATPTPPPRTIRDAADRALAVSARGRTRWSRAILSKRGKRLSSARKRCMHMQNTVHHYKSPIPLKRIKPAVEVERKVKILGRLVPGCRKLSFPSLLGEASDYIAALQMQIRAMSELTQILAAGAGQQS